MTLAYIFFIETVEHSGSATPLLYTKRNTRNYTDDREQCNVTFEHFLLPFLNPLPACLLCTLSPSIFRSPSLSSSICTSLDVSGFPDRSDWKRSGTCTGEAARTLGVGMTYQTKILQWCAHKGSDKIKRAFYDFALLKTPALTKNNRFKNQPAVSSPQKALLDSIIFHNCERDFLEYHC